MRSECKMHREFCTNLTTYINTIIIREVTKSSSNLQNNEYTSISLLPELNQSWLCWRGVFSLLNASISVHNNQFLSTRGAYNCWKKAIQKSGLPVRRPESIKKVVFLSVQREFAWKLLTLCTPGLAWTYVKPEYTIQHHYFLYSKL